MSGQYSWFADAGGNQGRLTCVVCKPESDVASYGQLRSVSEGTHVNIGKVTHAFRCTRIDTSIRSTELIKRLQTRPLHEKLRLSEWEGVQRCLPRPPEGKVISPGAWNTQRRLNAWKTSMARQLGFSLPANRFKDEYKKETFRNLDKLRYTLLQCIYRHRIQVLLFAV